jgi:predicted phosphodiesterase
MKILCSGDLHLGRRSSRLPADADAHAHSATRVWDAIVETAVERRVDLVALSGDLVDRANRFFEAVGPLERGLQRLAAAGIPAVAVAGNHDCDVLPKVARSLGGALRLLGEGGRWEEMTIERGGAPALRVVGWSFPGEHVHASPLAGIPPRTPDGVPVLGLLHGDLDQPSSPYAPLARADLRATGVWFWLLGHVHAPRLHAEAPVPLLYPGSPQALDPGETGPHGAWLLEMLPHRAPVAVPLPLSTVRYDALDVDVDGVEDADEMDLRITETVRAHAQRVADAGCGPLRHVHCRLRLVGRTRLHGGIEARVGARVADLRQAHGDVLATVERLEVATRPAVDLAELERGTDAPGLLARLLVALDGGGPDASQQRLMADLAARATAARRSAAYQALADPAPDPAYLRDLARRQALLLLDALLAQKEAA